MSAFNPLTKMSLMEEDETHITGVEIEDQVVPVEPRELCPSPLLVLRPTQFP